jgi:DNA repair protein RecO (recombination protein O)
MILRTDAIVLRAFDYGETSQIVALYTRQQGRVSVIARGSRRPKSTFGSTLQPLSYVQAVYYHRPTRDLQTLKEANHVVRLARLAKDIDRLGAGFRIIELLRGLTEPGEPNPALFNLALHALLNLDAAEHRALNALPHFQLRMAGILGFAPDIQREDVLAVPPEGGALALDRGSIHPEDAGPNSMRASREALRAFAIFARTDLATALRMDLSPAALDETLRLIDGYVRHHVEGRYPDRADAVMRRLREDRG